MAESMGKDLCPKKAYQNEVRIKDKMFCKETHMSSKAGSVFSYKKIVLSKVAIANQKRREGGRRGNKLASQI